MKTAIRISIAALLLGTLLTFGLCTAKNQTVNVSLGEWYVKIKPATVHPGTIVFNVANTGDITHTLEIKGNGIDKKLPKELKKGQKTTMTVVLKA
jgi:hypothetical protein